MTWLYMSRSQTVAPSAIRQNTSSTVNCASEALVSSHLVLYTIVKKKELLVGWVGSGAKTVPKTKACQPVASQLVIWKEEKEREREKVNNSDPPFRERPGRPLKIHNLWIDRQLWMNIESFCVSVQSRLSNPQPTTKQVFKKTSS